MENNQINPGSEKLKSIKNKNNVSTTKKKKLFKNNKKTKTSYSRRKNNKNSLFLKTSPDKYFYFSDGKVARSIEEFVNLLDSIDSNIFFYHVNDLRNDFYNWIKDVFNEIDLADRILPLRDPKSIQIVILKEMVSRLKPKRKNKESKKQ